MAEIQLTLNLIASVLIPLLVVALVNRWDAAKRRKAENERLVHALDRSWQRAIDHPFSKVCKHYVASNTLDEMERAGIDIPKWVVEAVVNCDDGVALSYIRGKSEVAPPEPW